MSGNTGIRTFAVSDVTPNKIAHSAILSLSNYEIKRWANNSETLSLASLQLVHPLADGLKSPVSNLFIGTIIAAYSQHYPLELSVEDIWVAIAQGVSIHLNENAEKYRHLFVSHEEKKKLDLIIDDLIIPHTKIPSRENISIPVIDWQTALRRMADLIKKDMKADLATLISQPFSQTTSTQQAVLDACLMDAVKKYYSYEFAIMCGIPQITLIGSPDDFQSVLDRLNQLKIFFPDLHWWLNPLVSHMKNFKASAEGHPDIEWWKNICYEHSIGCGDTAISGWLTDFVPYTDDGTGHYWKAKTVIHRSGNQEVTYGIDFSRFNDAVTQTDFTFDDNGLKYNMKLIAGFLGIGQNPETLALRPVLGWLTALTSPKPLAEQFRDEL